MRNGVMEYCGNGLMEYWGNGLMGYWGDEARQCKLKNYGDQ
jgi:hypothetical protein